MDPHILWEGYLVSCKYTRESHFYCTLLLRRERGMEAPGEGRYREEGGERTERHLHSVHETTAPWIIYIYSWE